MPIGVLSALSLADALALSPDDSALVDVRPVEAYLDAHIPGSLSLLYESGPGFPGRARDCIPLGVKLVLLDLGHGDLVHAASSLRGKGFAVLGGVPDPLSAWVAAGRRLASTDAVTVTDPGGRTLLDVGDPGARPPDGTKTIPIERLWRDGHELAGSGEIAVVSGSGVRAALAVGILERAGLAGVAVAR